MNAKEGFVTTRDGLDLFYKTSDFGKDVWVVAIHGISEHLGRHSFLDEVLSEKFNVFHFDLRGHGRSQGRRTYIPYFNQYMEDLQDILSFVRDELQVKRYEIFAHSMGALIASGFIQNYASDDFYPERLVLSAPPVGVFGIMGNVLEYLPLKLLDFLCKLPFSIELSEMVAMRSLSHDPKIAENFTKDELNAKTISSKLALELGRAAKHIFAKRLNPKCPAFVVLGSEDYIISAETLLRYFREVETAFKIKIIDGGYHELHHEIDEFRSPYLDYLKTEVFI